ERGGPVTVTHPEMTRYFMTIPEAVSLVVQAGAIGGRGQVFVLDMGEPVRIVELAQNMIRLSGKEPRLPDDPTAGSRDIRIAFVGSRPGEKIHEELWSETDSVGETTHPKIMRLSRPPDDPNWLTDQLVELERLAGAGTGKTTTITRRIAWQVASGAFPPEQIVAVTFTDKAAGELRARLHALGVEGVRASTFHSAALALLRNFEGDPGRILPSKAV